MSAARIMAAAVLATVCAALAVTAPAAAAGAPSGTSYAAAVSIDPGTGVDPVTGTSGDLAALLTPATPSIDEFTSALSTRLASIPATMVRELEADTGRLVAGSDAASPLVPPAGRFPSCDSAGWTQANCFQTHTAGATGAIVSLGIDSAQGFAAAGDGTATAGAKLDAGTLSALGVDLGGLGAIESTARCTASHDCSATSSAGGVSLLGGTVVLHTGAHGDLLAAVDGHGELRPADLATPVSVPGAQVSAVGDSVKVSVAISLDQLLASLDLGGRLADLGAVDDGSQISLDVIVGVPDGSDGGGLQVALGLDANVNVSVGGLVDATVTVADTGPGNLVRTQLARATATKPRGSDDPDTPQVLVT